MTFSNLGPNEHLVAVPESRKDIGTPTLVIELNILEKNIKTMTDHCALTGHSIRPVAKIHRSIDIAMRP